MIITDGCISSGGNEITLKTQDGEKYCISRADAKRIGLFDEDCFPVEYDDGEYLQFLSQKLRAVKYCQYLLTFSDKSSKTLFQKLREKQYDKDVCDAAIDVLKQSGMSDEVEMCKRKLKSLSFSKLYGQTRIRAELISKGFSSSDIDTAFDECDEDFCENCKKLSVKLLDSAGISSKDDERLIKIKAKLARYGHSYENIRRAINEYFS